MTDDLKKEKYNVIVVDDSAVIRNFTQRMLAEDPEINVKASLYNGEVALKYLSLNKDVDVVVLDIEMPVMSGMEALPQMLKLIPNLKVIMFSTLTTQNARISIDALDLGAADYVAKPSTNKDFISKDQFKRELLEKVKTFARIKRGLGSLSSKQKEDIGKAASNRSLLSVPSMYKSKEVKLRQGLLLNPEIIAIGSSTGGPQALSAIFQKLKGSEINKPIIITQHMPVTFTKILAQHLAKLSGLKVDEAVDGELIKAGRVYVAPGGLHMTLQRSGVDAKVKLSDSPPENFCRPAVDPMLRSVAEVYGGKVAVFILTGMGTDGFKGSEMIVNKGGTIFAQDEASSIVWGMPGAVATGGLCSKVLDLDDIAQHLKKYAK